VLVQSSFFTVCELPPLSPPPPAAAAAAAATAAAAAAAAAADPQKDCKVDTCLHRYNQLLLLQGCLGCIISYYAFTVGFLGAGPVTWLYRQLHKKHGV
jgi:hypothetical protein